MVVAPLSSAPPQTRTHALLTSGAIWVPPLRAPCVVQVLPTHVLFHWRQGRGTADWLDGTTTPMRGCAWHFSTTERGGTKITSSAKQSVKGHAQSSCAFSQ